MPLADQGSIQKLASALQTNHGGPGAVPLLHLAGRSYGSIPLGEDTTIPTGFDPHAAALFSAVVEGAYLVATQAGLPASLRPTFERAIVSGAFDTVDEARVHQLVQMLEQQARKEGEPQRLKVVARTIHTAEQRHEVLRVAAVLAYGLLGSEQHVAPALARLSDAFGLEGSAHLQALETAKRALL